LPFSRIDLDKLILEKMSIGRSNKRVTIIFSPRNVGYRDHRVGNGPNRIIELGLLEELEKLVSISNSMKLEELMSSRVKLVEALRS
jgi:hypothetical protein